MMDSAPARPDALIATELDRVEAMRLSAIADDGRVTLGLGALPPIRTPSCAAS